jgi:hypothetical protein
MRIFFLILISGYITVQLTKYSPFGAFDDDGNPNNEFPGTSGCISIAFFGPVIFGILFLLATYFELL